MLGKIKEILNRIKEYNSNLKQEPRSGELHSVAALFDTPDAIIKAAETVANAGYTKFDVYTPYAVHGMDEAMKIRDTKIGWVSFLAGLTGTMSALLMIGWMMGVSYKNIIGGKPFFSLPPSIPITFELTVLFSAIATALTLYFLFNKLPAISNPLHDTDFMSHASSDKFGIAIESADRKFDEKEVTALFKNLGSKEVSSVYYPIYDLGKTVHPILDFKFLTTLVVIIALTAGISYFVFTRLLFMTPFNFMWEQPKVLPQSQSTFFVDGYSMRMPVEGTVARGFIPYEYPGLPDSIAKPLMNPLPFTKEVLERGRDRFNSYCSPCHGYFARGQSRLHGQFPSPPSLHTDKIRNWPDGNIYNVITNGQNVMPSYAKSVSRYDRWAIINYIRVLQRALNAKDSDLVAPEANK
jgi:hypothetical protein